jgi:hypothetical protein
MTCASKIDALPHPEQWPYGRRPSRRSNTIRFPSGDHAGAKSQILLLAAVGVHDEDLEVTDESDLPSVGRPRRIAVGGGIARQVPLDLASLVRVGDTGRGV